MLRRILNSNLLLGGTYHFYISAKFPFLGRISLFPTRTEFLFLMLVVYAKDSLRCLETSLFLFSALRGGVIPM